MNKQAILHFLRGYLILLCCLLLLVVLMYSATFALFESRQLSLIGESLQSGMNRLDQQIFSWEHFIFSIGNNIDYLTISKLNPDEMTPADYHHVSNLHAEFVLPFLSQSYFSDYGLLFQNGILFTGERIHFPDEAYYGTFFCFGDMDRDTFLKTFLHNDTVLGFLPQMKVEQAYGSQFESYQAIVLLCNLTPTTLQRHYGVIYATISESILRSLFFSNSLLDDDNAGFRLTDRTGADLMSCGKIHEQTGMRCLSAAGASSGLNVELCISEKLFFNMMAPVRNILYLGFGVLLLAGLILSIFISLRASRPLNNLLSLVDQLAPEQANEADASGGFEKIGTTVTSLATSVEEYRQVLSAQQQIVRQHAFEELIRETPANGISDRRLHDFERYYPEFPAYFRMALVAFPRNATEELPKNQLILLNLVKSCFPQPLEICFYSRYAVLIIDLSRNQRYMAQLQQIKQLATQHGNIPLLIALSAEAVSCKELHVLFEHTRHLIHLVEAEPDPDVVEVWQRGNFPDLHDMRHLDYTCINQLYPLLIKGEKDSAVSLLRELGQEFMHASLTDDVMNCQFFYNVRSVLTRVKAENPELLQDLQIPIYHSEMEQAAMIELLEKCCCEVCARIYPTVSNRQAKFASSVIEYINANLANSELSVSMVSNQFSVSEPTLQKVIRQEKGCTFYDYVEKQRYALAVQMLRDTEKSITQIASDCGYNSFNSFYKAFKRLADISPAAMRQQLRQEE